MKNELAAKYNKNNIHDRIYHFVIRVIQFTKLLPKTSQNNVLIYQLVKSVSSMGANDREADASESRKDFVAKYSIVKKETNETLFWLEVIRDTNNIKHIKDRTDILINEGNELYKIIRSIIINTKQNH